MTHKIIFIDPICNLNHQSIKNIPIGASEYQFYNLVYNLALKSGCKVICFNSSANDMIIDNIEYINFSKFMSYDINQSDKIVIQRIFLNDPNFIKKIIKNKIFLWIHDLICNPIFLGNNPKLVDYFSSDLSLYKNLILSFFADKSNINYIVPSNFCKNMLYSYFADFGFHIGANNIHVIYNILYEEEFSKFIGIKNKDTNKDANAVVDKNQIVFGSAWTKNIDHVIQLFDYIYNNDKDIKLLLMSPGWDNDKFRDLEISLKNKYKERINIMGKQRKEDFCKIVKSSLCVLSSTFSETFGCVFAESYYMGVPVIADCRSGAVSEIIDNEYVIDYFKPWDVLEKIKKLQTIRDSIDICLDKKFLLDENINKWVGLLLN